MRVPDPSTRVVGVLQAALQRVSGFLGRRDVEKGRDSSIVNGYVATAPSAQNAIDIFEAEWTSKLPPPLDSVKAGTMTLFEDGRIKWLIDEVGDLTGRSVLELGPLEGGHSYMLARAGAQLVTAIEANTHAFLKCLVVKELLDLHNVKFLCGDFAEYLKDSACPSFDICVASGVLYHMGNPVELVSLLSRRCTSHLFVWTHYYDDRWAEERNVKSRFPLVERSVQDGFSHRLVRQIYDRETLSSAGFCGGSRFYSNWMYRDEIIDCLKFFGFSSIKINFDHYDHPHAPAFALIASRQS